MSRKRILLINSDLAKNRGDRAIAEGNVELIKSAFPDSQITGLSQIPERDSSWYGIDFLDMNFQSLNPLEFVRLCRAARQNDLVLWGGGEILKDYTNKAALWYWVSKMTVISLFNPNLYGAYQGIGPTKSAFSRRLIVFVVNRCKVFIVRDKESYDKLVSWGVAPDRLRHASDPAVLPSPSKPDSKLLKKLHDEYGIDNAFMEDFICIGPRSWFHYKPGGLLPFKYKQRLYRLIGKEIDTSSEAYALYLRQLAEAISTLSKVHKTHILLVPMHMDESDSELCHMLRDNSADPSLVRVLDKDNLSPGELRSVISQAWAMVGFRLHSNIIGISAGVPSINIYYVDKGRVFFDQIGQSRFALPIERTLEESFVENFISLFEDLVAKRHDIKKEIKSATSKLRKTVTSTFEEVFGVHK